MKEKKYNIKNISEKQINVIISALDCYSRLGSLQLEEAIIMPIKYNPKFEYPKNKTSIDNRLAEIRSFLVENDEDLKKFNPHDYWNLGIYNDKVPTESKSAFDMYCVLRQINKHKSLSKATDDEDIIISEMNLRKEKFIQLKNKLKK